MPEISYLDAWFLAGQDDLPGEMAKSFLGGDDAALCALHDLLEETGLETSMSQFQSEFLAVGEKYLFKTFGLYYSGTIRKMNAWAILLQDDVQLVVDVGTTEEALVTNKYTFSEPFPKGHKIIIPHLHIYAYEQLAVNS